MKPTRHRGKLLRPRGAARVIPEGMAGAVDDDGAFIEHPDGWYWVAPDGRQQFGPFETCALARADRDHSGGPAMDEDETLRDVEREAGLTDLIDVETGKPTDEESRMDSEEH